MESQAKAHEPVRWDDYEGRIEMACMGAADVADIPKVDGAGSVIHRDGVDWQLMFNGLRMRAGGYYGGWMTELIRRLGGHQRCREHKPSQKDEIAGSIFHGLLLQMGLLAPTL